MNTQGTQYDNLKFEAETYRTTAFAVVSLCGAIVLQFILFGMKSGWTLFWQILIALFSLVMYVALLSVSQGIMNDREWRIDRANRRTNK